MDRPAALSEKQRNLIASRTRAYQPTDAAGPILKMSLLWGLKSASFPKSDFKKSEALRPDDRLSAEVFRAVFGPTDCVGCTSERTTDLNQTSQEVRNVRYRPRPHRRGHRDQCNGLPPPHSIPSSHRRSAHSLCCSSTASYQRLLNSSSTTQPTLLPRDLSLPRRSR
jgi:hypothetical protein